MTNRTNFLFLIPGIRAKLSFFTAFFVIVIISIISILYLKHEYQSLSESYDREIQPLRKYTEKIVLDLENLANTFLLIEDFKFRLKSKTLELAKYRRMIVHVEEKSWFTKNILGQLNLIKEDFVDTKDKRHVSVHQTYYSEYITDKIVKDLEDNVRMLMKDEKGNTIPVWQFSKIQSIAYKIEEHKRTIDDKSDEAESLLSEKKETDEKGNKITDTAIIGKNKLIDSKIEKVKKEIGNLQNRLGLLKINLNSEILQFFYASQKNNIRELGLNTDVIRIQSFNTTDKTPGFDTRIFSETNTLNSQIIMKHPFIQKDLEDRIKNFSLKELIQPSSVSREVSIDEKDYEIFFRPILRKPHTVWRAKLILEEISSSKWGEFLKQDLTLANEFNVLSGKLRNRLKELKDKKIIRPSYDREFIDLYKQYKLLLKKRFDLTETYNTNKNYEVQNYQLYKGKENELTKRIDKLNLEIAELNKKPKIISEEEIKKIEDEIFKKSEELEDAKTELSNVQIKLLDWSHSRDLTLIDSLHNLREAAIYEYGILRTKNNSTDYSEYLESEKERNLMKMKWKSLRDWIMSANSEVSISPVYHDNRYINIFEGGVLSRSRSEIEEEMWKMDSTPIYHLNERNQLESVAADQYYKNIAGFTRTIVDKSEGLSKIRNDIQKIIYNASVLGMSAIVLAFFFSTLMVKSIRRISTNAQLVGKGFLDVKFDVKSKDEIGMLSETLNKMVIGLVERDKAKTALGKFVSPQIAEKVMKQELKLGGERKNCAIFFSDIRGFTSISEKLQPEEVVEFLNEYMTEMVNCVTQTEGIVDKFIGDAVMATWGAAFSHGNNAENAVNSALLMRKALIEFNKNRGTEKKPVIQIGCGINYGPVIAGQIGSDERLEYTVIGDAVNLASRVESLNKPMGTDILITQDLYAEVKDIFKVEKMHAIKVKGKEEPQIIYAVIGRFDDPTTPKSLEDLRAWLGIKFDSEKIVNIDEKEEKYEILPS